MPMPLMVTVPPKPTVAKKPFRIILMRFDGNVGEGFQYTITVNQSLVHTGRYDDMEDGMNYPRARTWIGRVWNALRNR